jgi:hypothetical protein
MDKILDKKRRTTSDDGDEMLELGIPCVNINKITANGVIRVSQDQKGRIDRFSQLNVGEDRMSIDLVMYYNHIFNPFSIDEGDIIFTPLYSENCLKSTGEPVLPDGSKPSTKASGEKELTYAEKVERAARTGLGVR